MSTMVCVALRLPKWRWKSWFSGTSTLAGLHNSQDWHGYGLAWQFFSCNLATCKARWVLWMYSQDNQIHSIQTSRWQSKPYAHTYMYLMAKDKHDMILASNMDQANLYQIISQHIIAYHGISWNIMAWHSCIYKIWMKLDRKVNYTDLPWRVEIIYCSSINFTTTAPLG